MTEPSRRQVLGAAAAVASTGLSGFPLSDKDWSDAELDEMRETLFDDSPSGSNSRVLESSGRTRSFFETDHLQMTPETQSGEVTILELHDTIGLSVDMKTDGLQATTWTELDLEEAREVRDTLDAAIAIQEGRGENE